MNNPEQNSQQFYTIQEVAILLKVSYLTVFRWIKSGKLKSYKAGKQHRIHFDDINSFIELKKV